MSHKLQSLDLFGVGIGPFNLSVASLAQSLPMTSCFVDAHSAMTWHPGLLLNDARMQTSPLKDMVTAVEPTSPYSFIAYLVAKKKIHAFMAAQMPTISRIEFADYLAWVARQLKGLKFDCRVESIDFSGDKFLIKTSNGDYVSQNLCLGSGKRPMVPSCARPFVNETCFHAAEIALRNIDLNGKTVAVIGGGQTGADVFLNILRRRWGEPEQVNWISRRHNFQALDEGVFTDQYFMPDYSDLFYDLPASVRQREIKAQKLTSDGITKECLAEIYQALYQERFVGQNAHQWQLKPARTLVGMSADEGGFSLVLDNGLTLGSESIQADVVILCTGFESYIPEYLEPLKSKINTTSLGQFELSKNFAVQWDGPKSNRIYAVNSGLHTHGIVEPQLSLTAWRSAKILNDLLGYAHFDLVSDDNIIDWGTMPTSDKKIMTSENTKGMLRVHI